MPLSNGDLLSRPDPCEGSDPICSPWSDHLGEVLITEEELHNRVIELGTAISRDYAEESIVVVGVLRGTFFFIADLMRAITIPAAVDFIAISRYGPTERTQGVVRFTKDLDVNIEHKHVLFVEDIVDTGLTMAYILRSLKARNPASLSICSLLDRPRRRIVEFDVAYIGFVIPDCWVVGYGLDYREQLRQLPHIAVFTPPGRPSPAVNGLLTPKVAVPPLLPRSINAKKQPD